MRFCPCIHPIARIDREFQPVDGLVLRREEKRPLKCGEGAVIHEIIRYRGQHVAEDTWHEGLNFTIEQNYGIL